MFFLRLHQVNALIWQIVSLWGSERERHTERERDTEREREREREAHLPPVFSSHHSQSSSLWDGNVYDAQWEVWTNAIDWKMRPCLGAPDGCWSTAPEPKHDSVFKLQRDGCPTMKRHSINFAAFDRIWAKDYKRFLFQINADLLNFLLIIESWKIKCITVSTKILCSTTVFNIDNNQKCFIKIIKMISEDHVIMLKIQLRITGTNSILQSIHIENGVIKCTICFIEYTQSWWAEEISVCECWILDECGSYSHSALLCWRMKSLRSSPAFITETSRQMDCIEL